MKRQCLKLFKTIFIGTIVLTAGMMGTVIAQGPPSLPSAPASPIPWGDPLLYTAIIFGYGLYKSRKRLK